MDETTLASAVRDVLAHKDAWISLLTRHVATLPPDRPPSGYLGDHGSTEQSYAQHELQAMRRDLGALEAALSNGGSSTQPCG